MSIVHWPEFTLKKVVLGERTGSEFERLMANPHCASFEDFVCAIRTMAEPSRLALLQFKVDS